jgi:O-antigen/teichoic acid export membrane protein
VFAIKRQKPEMLQYSQLGKAITFSSLSQGLASGANFLIAIVLIRSLPPSEFGKYGIGFAFVLLYAGFGHAVFLSQMTANAADREVNHREEFASLVLLGIVVASISIAILIAASAYTLTPFIDVVGSNVKTILTFNLFAASYFLRAFFVSYGYLFRRELYVLIVNSIVTFALFAMLGTIIFLKKELTIDLVATIYSLALVLGSFYGLFASNMRMKIVSITNLAMEFIELWRNGRWALIGVIVNWLQSQAHIAVSAVMLGPTGVGIINAAKIFVSPFLLLLPAAHQIVLPRLASRRVSDPASVPALGRRYAAFLLGAAVLFTILLYFFFDFLWGLIGREQYSEAASLVAFWCAVLLLATYRSVAVTVLQSLKQFRGITLDNSISAILVIIMAVFLTGRFETSGAVVSLAIGEGILALMLWRRISRIGSS